MRDIPTECHVCESHDLEWFVSKTRQVQTDMSTLHEVGVQMVLGCNECSETLFIEEGDTFLQRLWMPATHPAHRYWALMCHE